MGRKKEDEPEYNCVLLGPTPGPKLDMLLTVAPKDVLKMHEWLDKDGNGSSYSLMSFHQGWCITFTKLPGGGLSITSREIEKS